jgi:hypothetical protein
MLLVKDRGVQRTRNFVRSLLRACLDQQGNGI